MSIGANIRNLRESHNLTQADLAEIAGVSNKAVSSWENDLKTPRMGAIQKIADYFGINKSQIIEEHNWPDYAFMRDLTPFDITLLNTFHASSNDTKQIICKILDISPTGLRGFSSKKQIPVDENGDLGEW